MNAAKRYEVAALNAGQEATPTRLPHVLYLAGVPRSGSTVLGQTLGNIPDVIFVGELRLFWRRFANGELCSCGQTLPSCRFWSAVISKGFGDLRSEDAQNLGKLEWGAIRRQAIRSLLPMRRKITGLGRWQPVADARAKLYCSIADVAQVGWIVDSGKDPWFGGFLSRLFGNNFSTVHIVRDPRGVAFSWVKLVKSDSEPGYMPRRHPARSAFSWLIQNFVIQFAMQRQSTSYVRIRYEDLATDPKAVVRDITRSTGIGTDRLLTAEGYEGRRHDLHWVAGNPGVRQSAGSSLQIKLDEEWRNRLPRVQRWLVTVIGGVLFPFYGYPLR